MEVQWISFPENLQSGESISCIVDGTEVAGRVSFSTKEMAVVTSAPVAGLRGGMHIMAMAPYTYCNPDGTANHHLVKTAKDILPVLCDRYKSLEAIIPEIEEGLDAFNEEYDRLSSVIALVKAKRTALRRRLRNGEMDNITYQKSITPIRKEIESLEYRQGNLFDTTFRVRERCGYDISGMRGLISSMLGKEIRTGKYTDI